MTIQYAIPPLSPAEAFEWIRDGLYHRCDESAGPDMRTCFDCSACKCLEFFLGVLRGEPGEHDQPYPRPKTWEEMDEHERLWYEMLKNQRDRMIEDGMVDASFFLGPSWPDPAILEMAGKYSSVAGSSPADEAAVAGFDPRQASGVRSPAESP